MKPTSERAARPAPPPPLEADDLRVIRVITAGWAVALVVMLIIRGSLPAGQRWWVWTCVAGLAFGLFGLWYVPRLKRGRSRAAASREPASLDETRPDAAKLDGAGPAPTGSAPTGPAAAEPAPTKPAGSEPQSAPRASGSNTVSSTETPGRSTKS